MSNMFEIVLQKPDPEFVMERLTLGMRRMKRTFETFEPLQPQEYDTHSRIFLTNFCQELSFASLGGAFLQFQTYIEIRLPNGIRKYLMQRHCRKEKS